MFRMQMNRNARLHQWLIDANVLTAASGLEYTADWESSCSTNSSVDTVYRSRSLSSRASSPPASPVPPPSSGPADGEDTGGFELALVVPSARRPAPFLEPTFTVDIL